MSAGGYTFHIDVVQRCVFMKYFNELTFNSFIDRQGKAQSHPDFDPDFHSIVDICGCDIRLNGDEIREMATVVGDIYQNQETARDAFIVDTVVGHGLTRMFTSSIPDHQAQIQIFDATDEDVAIHLRQWLEIPSNYVFPDFIGML